MKYTKVFEDVFNGGKYFVSECCVNNGEVKHLVLCEIDGMNIVEVDNGYEGVTIKRVGYTLGDLIEISIEEFDKRFVKVKCN